MDKLPQRKNIRLKNYDYSKSGYYFITICTHHKQCLLSRIVGNGFHAVPQTEQTSNESDGDGTPSLHTSTCHSNVGNGFHAVPKIELTPIGKEIEQIVKYIDNNYNGIKIDKYTIMPNHIHLIIILQSDGREADGNESPSIQNVVGRLKSFSTKKYNEINKTQNMILWQKSYHDHIIRGEEDYQKIWGYIEMNPLKWELDKYYCDFN